MPYKETFPQLQLSLTYTCNMACSYCSFRARMNADGRPLNMKKNTALDAVDFFVEEIAGKSRHARIDFGLTGKIFLRHKMHADLKEKVRARTAPLSLRSVSVGPNTTNGTLSDDIGLDAAMGRRRTSAATDRVRCMTQCAHIWMAGVPMMKYTQIVSDRLYQSEELVFDAFSLGDLDDCLNLGTADKYVAMAMAVGHPSIPVIQEDAIFDTIDRIAAPVAQEMMQELSGRSRNRPATILFHRKDLRDGNAKLA